MWFSLVWFCLFESQKLLLCICECVRALCVFVDDDRGQMRYCVCVCYMCRFNKSDFTQLKRVCVCVFLSHAHVLFKI